MLRLAKKGLRKLVHRAGYELVRPTIFNSEALRTREILSLLGIDLVIDVGANVGQFAQRCRNSGYRGEIVSFEPLRDAHAFLKQKAASDPQWTVAERMAIGEFDGEVEINVAGNSESSSILSMLGNHLDALPESKSIEKQVVPVRRLDDVIGSNIEGRRILLKLDVQGFEPQALRGARRLVPEVTLLKLEMSLAPLYSGEMLMPQMYSMLEELGFQVWDLEPGFRHQRTGRLLQIDGLFANTRKTADHLHLAELPERRQ